MSKVFRLTLNAGPDPEPASTALLAQPPKSVRSAAHECDFAHHGTDVADFVKGAGTEEGSWQTVYRQHRRKNKNKIFGTLLPGNGGLIGVERIYDLYLGGRAFETSEIDVLSHK